MFAQVTFPFSNQAVRARPYSLIAINSITPNVQVKIFHWNLSPQMSNPPKNP